MKESTIFYQDKLSSYTRSMSHQNNNISDIKPSSKSNHWENIVSEPVNNKQLIVQSVIFLIPIMLHILGLLLLYVTRHAQQRCTQFQRIYLINLSVIQILRGTLKVLFHLLMIPHSTKQAAFYLWLIQISGAFLWYILVLVLITFDRFLEVYLNLKYRLYCSLKCTIIALVTSFLLSFIMSLTFCLFYKDFNVVYRLFLLYVWPVTELTFLVVALFTYSYLFVQIRANRQKTKQTLHNISVYHDTQPPQPVQNHHTQPKLPALKYNRIQRMKQRLYLPSFLILVFVLLWILPDMMAVAHALKNKPIPPAVTLALNICYALAISADVLIYVFSMVAVRRHLIRYFYNFLSG